MKKNICIKSIPAISAIYFSLLQCGYDFYQIEKSPELTDKLSNVAVSKYTLPFFYDVKQTTCEVYPYWPRAAILETATFYLRSDHTEFLDFHAFRSKIMSSDNISDTERNMGFWQWIEAFPSALIHVLHNENFQSYYVWEKEWIKQQNTIYKNDLYDIQVYLNICTQLYSSPVKNISIVLNPIKCAYSADYHINKDSFVFCSGKFSKESIIHEFLHHIVHNTVISHSENILHYSSRYPGIDPSYYLNKDKNSSLNAFEEYFVRLLTTRIISKNPPKRLDLFLKKILDTL